MKKSTVKSVQANGTYDSDYGLRYKWEVQMENGDVGENATTTNEQKYFTEGAEVEYLFEGGDRPKIKRPYKQGAQSGQQSGQSVPKDDKTQLYIIRQSSLKAAIDYNNIIMGDTKPTIDDICSDAEHFTKYVLNGLGKAEESTNPTVYSTPPKLEEEPPPDDDGLPF